MDKGVGVRKLENRVDAIIARALSNLLRKVFLQKFNSPLAHSNRKCIGFQISAPVLDVRCPELGGDQLEKKRPVCVFVTMNPPTLRKGERKH